MKIQFYDIEQGDDGCPICGSKDGDYRGTYDEVEPVIIDIQDPKLLEDDDELREILEEELGITIEDFSFEEIDTGLTIQTFEEKDTCV